MWKCGSVGIVMDLVCSRAMSVRSACVSFRIAVCGSMVTTMRRPVLGHQGKCYGRAVDKPMRMSTKP